MVGVDRHGFPRESKSPAPPFPPGAMTLTHLLPRQQAWKALLCKQRLQPWLPATAWEGQLAVPGWFIQCWKGLKFFLVVPVHKHQS